MYRVEFSNQAARAFRNLSPDIQRRIDPAILALAENPPTRLCEVVRRRIFMARPGWRLSHRLSDSRQGIVGIGGKGGTSAGNLQIG